MLHLWCKDSNNPVTVSADNHPTKQHLFYMFYSPQEKYMLKLHLIDWTRVVTQVHDLSLGRGFPWPFHSGHLCGQIAGLFTWEEEQGVCCERTTHSCAARPAFPHNGWNYPNQYTFVHLKQRGTNASRGLRLYLRALKSKILHIFIKSVSGIIKSCLPINFQS